MKYKHLFFDLDHTLWDFDANAKSTLLHLYEAMGLQAKGVDDFEKFYQNYLLHNAMLWARYRNGFIKQADLRIKRMRLALLDFKIADEALAQALSEEFLSGLPLRKALFPGAVSVLNYLENKGYQLHLITNGFEEVQHHKINNAGLSQYFTEVITSERANSLKPHPQIFDYALTAAGAQKDQSIMLGDDWEADVEGARKAGWAQVYINHLKKPPPAAPTYMVHHLQELTGIF